jgi:hypothetical protein
VADNRSRDIPEDEDDPRPRRRPAPPEDDEDDEEPRPRKQSAGSDAAATVIPYRNVPALIGYYAGVFSLIPCLGLALAPVAGILGIIGLVIALRNPKAKGTAHSIVAMVLAGVSVAYHVGISVYLQMAAG